MTWADVRRGILRKRRTPAEVAADLRRVAAGDLMRKAEVTHDLLLQAAEMLDGAPAPAEGER